MAIDVEKIYKDSGAYLEGHFKLSSGNYSKHYLQSAKVLEDPKTAKLLVDELAKQIKESGIKVDAICSPALGGLVAGFALATALGVRFIFAERVDGEMTIRRGFEVKKGEKYLICEDIITTGGSALEAASEVEKDGGEIVGFAALANRGFCSRVGTDKEPKSNCKLPCDKPLFALDDFEFEIYTEDECDFVDKAYKPGSRGN
jgi:orotate phosphoribosyltransferase